MEEDRISGILIYKPWFEAIQFERGLAQYDVGLVFKEVRTYSDQDKLKFIENVWKPGELFDFPASVEYSNQTVILCWADRWKDSPG